MPVRETMAENSNDGEQKSILTEISPNRNRFKVINKQKKERWMDGYRHRKG